MDPNANLQQQLDLARYILAEKTNNLNRAHAAEHLAELVQALHDWLAEGGFKPTAWNRKTKKK